MKILVDFDACPKPVEEILKRASNRVKIKLIFVANRYSRFEKSELISFIKVSSKIVDSADNKIVEILEEGDLVITADIPLANRVVDKKGFVLTPYGKFLTENNIKQQFAMRNLVEDLRNSGVNFGGNPPFNHKNKHDFATKLDKFLSQYLKKNIKNNFLRIL